MSSLESTENKQLLWGVLMEEGIFESIPGSIPIENLQRVFETTLHNLSNAVLQSGSPQPSLRELNRIAIQNLVISIPRAVSVLNATSKQQQQQQHIMADDFHNQKRQDIETKLREKEAEMRMFLDRPKPPDIDFSDFPRKNSASALASAARSSLIEVVNIDTAASMSDIRLRPKDTSYNNDNNDNNDKNDPNAFDTPIGDDMDRLIAERIAARERDLAEITQRIKPDDVSKTDMMVMRTPVPPPLTHPPSMQPSSTASMSNPKVRFADEISTILDDDAQPVREIDDIYSKLKRKQLIPLPAASLSSDSVIIATDTPPNTDTNVSMRRIEEIFLEIKDMFREIQNNMQR